MSAAALLEEIRAAGLRIDPAPEGLRVTPKDRLTDELRQKIRAHKAELLAAIGATPNDRTAFALKNHAAAIRHFRRAVRETERLTALYQSKIDAHIEAARKRLPPDGFDAWLNELELEGDRHE